MSADAFKKYSQSPQKRIAFLELVEYYVNQSPRWTPADGALLVNGLIPSPQGSRDIPESEGEARQLDDPNLPATHQQLRGAKRVLEDYLDHVRDGDLPSSDEVLSDDFLKWCYDSDQAPWHVPKLPEFLRHLYFPGSKEHPFAPSVADELASLKLAVKEDAASRIYKTSGPGKRPGLYTEILLAQDEARQKGLDQSDPDVIWGILDRMSNDPGSKSPRLRGSDRDGIKYVSAEGPKTYTYKALKKYLSRK
ncbi:hypothetical protein B0G75_102261 [Paraburkholderia sp. BL18I3N2]|uniref:hypothetical protein n=1 Tax=Paraburkholderia sp. BL18I3N2 TaxID=1938799 RepID=UPI000D07046C|nr:hypothetical protein [Paraburkholderia sp. BL18I3N2]PRX34232.1 hypothetical protein B0G75_102261 [Paraburkholderia sp. BL18I3N2]